MNIKKAIKYLFISVLICVLSIALWLIWPVSKATWLDLCKKVVLDSMCNHEMLETHSEEFKLIYIYTKPQCIKATAYVFDACVRRYEAEMPQRINVFYGASADTWRTKIEQCVIDNLSITDILNNYKSNILGS